MFLISLLLGKTHPNFLDLLGGCLLGRFIIALLFCNLEKLV